MMAQPTGTSKPTHGYQNMPTLYNMSHASLASQSYSSCFRWVEGEGKIRLDTMDRLFVPYAGMHDIQIWSVHSDQARDFCIRAV